jgi:hypothetical protein
VTPGLGLLRIVLGAAAGMLALYGLERWLRLPGLANLAVAVGLMVAAVLGLSDGRRLVPILFLLQAPGFLYFAWFRRSRARAIDAGAAGA